MPAAHKKEKEPEMTTATYFHKLEEGFLARLLAGAKSFGASLIAAREREAQRYVNSYLATLSDETLASMGIERKTLEDAPKVPYFV